MRTFWNNANLGESKNPEIRKAMDFIVLNERIVKDLKNHLAETHEKHDFDYVQLDKRITTNVDSLFSSIDVLSKHVLKVEQELNTYKRFVQVMHTFITLQFPNQTSNGMSAWIAQYEEEQKCAKEIEDAKKVLQDHNVAVESPKLKLTKSDQLRYAISLLKANGYKVAKKK